MEEKGRLTSEIILPPGVVVEYTASDSPSRLFGGLRIKTVEPGLVKVTIDGSLSPELRQCLLAEAAERITVLSEARSCGNEDCQNALAQAREMGLATGKYLAKQLGVLSEYLGLMGIEQN